MQLSGRKIPLGENASLLYCPSYIDQTEADQLLQFCVDDIHWDQSRIMMFGKRIAIPRLNAWYGDQPYRYSGTTFDARKLPAPLCSLQRQINRDTSLEFNSVLANLYRDGNDSMGWHSDDEKSLGRMPQIASVSLGVQRRFLLRSRVDHNHKRELILGHGSLLLMLGKCQSEWQHSLPKSRGVTGQRVNLTFRESLI